ncbi:MAG: 16S rRNA (guanine527-N7)-methyltransferase [Chloroflexi bacterium]|nr:MAG: 16S rRNA (guanine527-N7)-methyltransferase [Chloroflexota bacterium]MBA4376081.1 16S rRNA (guanine(527)-N(7))-methyltransferase RsmG [Anaerolinea sp.]
MEQFLTETNKICGVSLNLLQQKAFEVYEHELIRWNQKFNLTAIREEESIRVKHFVDSLSCLVVMKNLHGERVIDIGTGAGFPGIPLKIARPGIKLTLVESVGKKASFCTHVVETLHLENVEVLTLRAEEVGRLPVHRERYDWALARAVAGLPILSEYLLPLLKIGGSMLAQKGESAHAEAQASENAFKHLGGELDQITKVTLPGVVEERFLVVVKKISATPQLYPRSVGIPSKKPL